MKTPQFDSRGRDDQTFKPFVLINALDTEWSNVRLKFFDWSWFDENYGEDYKDGYYRGDYYLNGYGVECLVKATLFSNGLDPDMDAIEYDSEAETCYIYFKDMDKAVQVAELCAQMLADPLLLRSASEVALEQGFDDG